jgi:hypothetical protein
MASWKKVLVSGSAGEFSSVTASIGLRVGTNQLISTNPADTRLSGSFSGSFTGDGSGLSGVTANFPSVQVTSLDATLGKYFINTGSGNVANAYITHDDVLDLLTNGTTGTAAGGNILKNGTALALNASLANLTSVTSTGFTSNAAANTIGFSGTASWAQSASQAVSSSFATTASFALNAGGGTLNISASNNTNTSISLSTEALIISGTANQIAVNIDNANNLLTIGLPNNVTIPGNLSVTGTTTTVSASSLIVTDKFILLASSSTTVASDGGIIVQNTVANNTGSGYGFILDGAGGITAPRWGVTSSLKPTATNDTTPDEYMVTAKTVGSLQTAGSTAPTYGGQAATGNGNMVIDSAGDIWIYVF